VEVFKYNQPIIGFMANAKKFAIALHHPHSSLNWGLAFRGLNYGIDFAGGTVIQVKYEGNGPI